MCDNCVWTCCRCGNERDRPDRWMGDVHPEANRVMYCADCDAAEWHKPPASHRIEYTKGRTL